MQLYSQWKIHWHFVLVFWPQKVSITSDSNGSGYCALKCSLIAGYIALTGDFSVLGHTPRVCSSGNEEYVWYAVILDLLCTMRTAVKFRKCIVTNRCLFWQMSHIVSASYYNLQRYSNHTLLLLTEDPTQCLFFLSSFHLLNASVKLYNLLLIHSWLVIIYCTSLSCLVNGEKFCC